MSEGKSWKLTAKGIKVLKAYDKLAPKYRKLIENDPFLNSLAMASGDNP